MELNDIGANASPNTTLDELLPGVTDTEVAYFVAQARFMFMNREFGPGSATLRIKVNDCESKENNH